MSFITTKQVQAVQIARRVIERKSGGAFGEPDFRIALRNAGKVKPDADGRVSCKNLDQAGFENVMALFEEMGYREQNQPADHWRSRCNGLATTRQVHELKRLAEQGRYPLASMCKRNSQGRTEQPDKLTVKEAHRLIEAYKAMIAREAV